jgi:hypothetical protein
MPALRAHDQDQQKKLRALMQALIAADGKSSLFKLAVKKAVSSRLAGLEKPPASEGGRSLGNEMLAVLSALAGIGHRSPEAADAAFNAALEALGEKGTAGRFRRSGQLTLEELSRALDRLAAAAPGAKRIFLEACAA